MSEERFIPSKKRYATGKYSKRKIGIGVGGEGAFLFVTPRAGDDFDDDLLFTIHLMACAPAMYEKLKEVLAEFDYENSTEADFKMAQSIKQLLSECRGE